MPACPLPPPSSPCHPARPLPITAAAAPHLLDAQVCVDGCVARCARQVLVLPVRDVDVGLGVAVLLGQTKVNHVDLRGEELGEEGEHGRQTQQEVGEQGVAPEQELTGPPSAACMRVPLVSAA
jgi:hypothetical protein